MSPVRWISGSKVCVNLLCRVEIPQFDQQARIRSELLRLGFVEILTFRHFGDSLYEIVANLRLLA